MKKKIVNSNGPSSTTAGEIPEMSVADNHRNSEIFAQTHDEAVRCSAWLGDSDIFNSLFDAFVFCASVEHRGFDTVSDPSKHLPPRKRNVRHPSDLGHKLPQVTVEVSHPHKEYDCQLSVKRPLRVFQHKHKRPLWVNQLLSEYSEAFLREVDSYSPIVDVEVVCV